MDLNWKKFSHYLILVFLIFLVNEVEHFHLDLFLSTLEKVVQGWFRFLQDVIFDFFLLFDSLIHLIEVLITLLGVFVLALLVAQGDGCQKSVKKILIEDLLVIIF